jgi:hypothetical protein
MSRVPPAMPHCFAMKVSTIRSKKREKDVPEQDVWVTTESKYRFLVQAIAYLAVLAVALYVIASGTYGDATEKWAIGVCTFVAGRGSAKLL